MKTRSNTIFDTVWADIPGRNTFQMPCDKKMSLDAGRLYPTHVQEVYPGDKFTFSSQYFLRTMPMASPAMQRYNIYQYQVFVPYRILWPNFKLFITGGQPGSGVPSFPVVPDNPVGYPVGSLADYLGLPVDVARLKGLSAMVPAAYNLIWNEYFRDQNLQSPIDTAIVDGGTNPKMLDALMSKPQRIAWEHDYVTSCLPWPQKGGDVYLPFTNTDAPLVNDPSIASLVKPVTGGSSPVGAIVTDGTHLADTNAIDQNVNVTGHTYADLSNVLSLTLNDLREAEMYQQFLEALARGGSRMNEVTETIFGVRSSDARLQRPEVFSASSSPLVISEIEQTSQTADTPQGNLAGKGAATDACNGTYVAEEWGIIMCLVAVRPVSSYQQGVHKFWNKTQQLDFYWPQFAELGEQPVFNKEIYAQGTPVDDDVFGYLPYAADLRYNPSTIAGQMRSTLSYWHSSRIFDSLPTLSSEVISCIPRKDIFADTSEDSDSFIMHIWHDIEAERPLPLFTIPSIAGV